MPAVIGLVSSAAACTPSRHPRAPGGGNTVARDGRPAISWGRMDQLLYRDAVSAPVFLPDGERFWVLDPRGGGSIRVIDPRANTVDDVALPENVRAPSGIPGLSDVRSLTTAGQRVVFAAGSAVHELDPIKLAVAPAAPADSSHLANAEPRVVRPGLFRHVPPIREVASPDSAWLAGIQEHDLWIRPARSGAGRALTTDGSPERPWDVDGARWSPDGSRLAVTRVDLASVPRVPLVRFAERGQPIEWGRYSRAGEPIPRVVPYIVERAGGAPREIDVGSGRDQFIHLVGWSRAGDVLYLLRASRLMDQLELLAADPATGRTRVLLDERSSSFIVGLDLTFGYSRALAQRNHVVMLDGGGFLWTSEQSGWRQIELHDARGQLVRQLTTLPRGIERLEHVDEQHGWIYVRARTEADWPFRVGLYRVPLAGGKAQLLLSGHSIGRLWFTRSSGAFVVEHAPAVDQPRVELRSAAGTVLRELWHAQPDLVRKHGWRPPEHVVATAADGKTPIFVLLFKPIGFRPDRQYPVLEYNYASPASSQIVEFPRGRGQDFAELGAIVVVIDGRSSSIQSKRVQDSVHGTFGRYEVLDHVAALEQLARERPYMDMTRVAITGHSWGGYFALRSMLQAPATYIAAAVSSPGVDLVDFRIAVEPYMGCLPAACPAAYEEGSNTRLVSSLRGKLFLLHGAMDDDVPLSETMKLVRALHHAGKHHELVLLPEAHHLPQIDPAYRREVRRFLGEHLKETSAASYPSARP